MCRVYLSLSHNDIPFPRCKITFLRERNIERERRDFHGTHGIICISYFQRLLIQLPVTRIDSDCRLVLALSFTSILHGLSTIFRQFSSSSLCDYAESEISVLNVQKLILFPHSMQPDGSFHDPSMI